MLKLHHLRIGRSIYTVWLLEELGVEYELKEYVRNANMRAGDDLKVIHPLGKSPVIEDGDLILTESGAITSYLLEKFDQEQKFSPSRDDVNKWAKYTQWLHYSEGSVFAPLLINMLLKREKSPSPLLTGFSQAEITLHLSYIAKQLGDNEFMLGDKLSGADFGMTYVIATAQQLGQLDNYPNLVAYVERNKARSAFLAAIKRAVE